MGEKQRKYFPLPPPPLAPAHSGTTSTVFILYARARPDSALGKVIEEKRKRARLCLLSPHISLRSSSAGPGSSPPRGEREGGRERERGREGEGKEATIPSPRATRQERRQRRGGRKN